MIYQLMLKTDGSNEQANNGVKRIVDGAWIPFRPDRVLFWFADCFTVRQISWQWCYMVMPM
ncbi:MAG: hypothetical protein EBU08_12915 [Micrococcales bacterium]|nr:hypothetical protein [Micrococcales bacterium]